MQKNIRKIFALFFGVLMIFSMSACQQNNEPAYEPESAAALWAKVDETMNTLQSMEMTTTTKVVFFKGGYQYELDGTAYVLSTKEDHYTESVNVVSSDELSLEQTTKVVEAYYGGKMYLYNSDGIYEQKLCAEMTHEEYDQKHGGELTEELEIADCTKSEFSKGEENTWNLHFSGYTKKTIDKALEMLSVTDDLLGAPIADMEVNLVADADFYVKTLEIRFSFTTEKGEVAPQFTLKAEYKGYNSVAFDPAKLNVEEYVAVDDVRVMEAIADALQERQNASAGKFTLTIATSYERQGLTQSTSETDVVTYGRKNGAYNYQITAQMDGKNFQIQYQNGEQTVNADGQIHTASQSEKDAKAFIDGLINTARYNANAVSNVEKQAEGVYVLTCAQLNLTEYTQSLTENHIELTSGTQQITVTFQEGTLMKIESTITLVGSESSEPMNMVIASVVTFDDSKETV